MKRKRITISLSTKKEDSATVLLALKDVKRWKRSEELVRWAAAYLNGEALVKTKAVPELGMTEEELDAAMDNW